MGRFGNLVHHGLGPILMDVDDSLDARIIRVFRKIFRDSRFMGGTKWRAGMLQDFADIQVCGASVGN